SLFGPVVEIASGGSAAMAVVAGSADARSGTSLRIVVVEILIGFFFGSVVLLESIVPRGRIVDEPQKLMGLVDHVLLSCHVSSSLFGNRYASKRGTIRDP